MTEWIDQFEYRWRPAKDFSLITGSRQTPEIIRWSDRIALWVRHPPVRVPVESMRYEIFGDGTAALAWRQRNAQADGFQEGREGRPEVSRVLIGPVPLLPPTVAVALCRTGLPEAVIGPRPGVVPVDTALPRVDAAALDNLAYGEVGELDKLALSEKAGLYKVIAAALTDADTALSVQLPDRYIFGALQECMQGSLLWGLLRTLSPLLSGHPGSRGWSFSTFELPLGDMDTRGLPDIVFRAHGSSQRPSNMRPEIVVRPFDASDLPDEIRHQEFAELLVAAYRQLGGERLGQCLAAISELPSLEQRIEQAEEMLYEVLPAEALSAARQRHVPVVDASVTEPAMMEPPTPGDHLAATAEPSWPEHAATPDSFLPPASPAPSHRTAPSRPAPMPSNTSPSPAPPASFKPPSWQKTPEASYGASDWTNEPAPPLLAGMSRPRQTGAAPRNPVSSLLDQLDEGPADPRFESALQSLWTGSFPDLPADRNAARKRMPERGWYIRALTQHDSAHFEAALEKIFERVVVPDLGSPEVTEELARWASIQDTPPSVFRALNAAAQSWPGWPDLMEQILLPAAGRRWFIEHEIYIGPTYATPAQRQRPYGAQAGARGARAARGHRQERGLLDHGLFDNPVTLLSLFCAVLIALLVLSLVH